jgi:hypothetical protein
MPESVQNDLTVGIKRWTTNTVPDPEEHARLVLLALNTPVAAAPISIRSIFDVWWSGRSDARNLSANVF